MTKKTFKGTDTIDVELTAEDIGLVNGVIERVENWAGNVADTAEDFIEKMENAEAGELELSHDELALGLEIINKAVFARAGLPAAKHAKLAIKGALESFYKPNDEDD